MFTKLGRDEVLIAPHMDLGVFAISTQGRIQGGGPFLKKIFFRPESYSNQPNDCIAII